MKGAKTMYNEKLRKHIDMLFEEAPPTKKTVEVKEEILQNLFDKFSDLVAEGKSEESAYNIVVAGIGDLSGLIEELKGTSNMNSPENIEKREQEKKRSAIITAIAVAMYIMCVIPLFVIQNTFGLVAMFVIVGLATALLIYNYMTKSQHTGMDATMAEEFKEWRDSNNDRKRIFRSIASAIWSLALVLYFIISFTTHAWHLTWLIFLIAAAVNSIVKAVFDLKR